MSVNEDNIILLPLTVILIQRLNIWNDSDFIRFRDKNNETVFSGSIPIVNYKNVYNINLKQGKYNIQLDPGLVKNRQLISWDVYVNDNGVLKNICSSDNYKCEINDGCDPDTFIVSLDDYNKKTILNSDSANIKSASIDELQVNSIQFGNIPLKMKIEKYENSYDDKIFHLRYGDYAITRKFSYNNVKSKSLPRKLLFSYPVKK